MFVEKLDLNIMSPLSLKLAIVLYYIKDSMSYSIYQILYGFYV